MKYDVDHLEGDKTLEMAPIAAPALGKAEVADVAGVTHVGHVRKNNEDQFLISRFGRSLENIATSLGEEMRPKNHEVRGYGMMVADGIGGAVAGEVASSIAINRLNELVVTTPDWILSLDNEADVSVILQRMSKRFLEIDETLRVRATRDTSLHGMGTTFTAAASLYNDLLIGHVGDSRAYLLRDSTLKQLTTDHTLAQTMIDAGLTRRDDPATSLIQHVLVAALGSLGDRIKPQVRRLQAAVGDQILLCTDGLTNMVDDTTIASVLQQSLSAQKACDALLNLALAAGGLDNITIVVARFGLAQTASVGFSH